MPGTRVLLIEDDYNLAKAVITELNAINFTVEHISNGIDGLARARSGTFNVIVIDLMLPGLEGAEVCRNIRQNDLVTPIVVLTARGHESDKVLLLELGADDFITKPFSLAEFRARIKAAARRGSLASSPGEQDQSITRGNIVIDPVRRRVFRDGEDIKLTAREFEYVYLLAKHPGRAYSRDQLSQAVQGYDAGEYGHSVSSAINRIRAKMEVDPTNPEYLLTVRGVGYCFAEEL